MSMENGMGLLSVNSSGKGAVCLASKEGKLIGTYSLTGVLG